MEVEENIWILKLDIGDHPRTRAKVNKEKSKDQHEETLLSILKKIDRSFEEANKRETIIMNKLTTLERAQKSSYIPKGTPFPRKKSEEDRLTCSQFLNTLASTNVV